MLNVDHLTGQQIDHYVLGERLGSGAMGAVYRAHQRNLDRDVAVKVLPPALAEQSDYASRFTREAKIVAALEHPHIVPIHDYGTEDGLSYVVMRLLSGGTLAERLNQRHKAGGPLPSLGETAHLLRQLANALDYAHRRGVIHRDIKPGNIMFDPQGSAYLVDFGIARLVDTTTMTSAERTFGTPHYMPPEQWRDENLSPETDQYALAVVIYTMLTGSPPFEAPTPHALMYKHMNEMPPPPNERRADLPDALDGVMARALAKLPSERFLTVTAFAQAFEAAVAGNEGTATDFFTFSLPDSGDGNRAPESAPPRPAAAPAPPAPEPPTIPAQAYPADNTVSRIQAAPAPPEPPPLPPAMNERTVREERRNGVPPLVIGGVLGLALLGLVVCGGLALVGSQLGIFNREIPSTAPVQTTSEPVVIGPVVTAGATDDEEPTPLPVPGSTGVAAAGAAVPPAAQGTAIAANVDALQRGESLNHGVEVVRGLAFTPDARTLVTGTATGALRTWDTASGAAGASFGGAGGGVYAAAMRPAGNEVVTGHDDGSVRVWDIQAQTQVALLSGHSATVRDVAYSPDGGLVASASEDRTARIWDLASRELRFTLQGHAERVLAVAFSPDGTRVATASDDGTARVWDTATGNSILTLNAGGQARDVVFSPDGQRIATAATDGAIRIWDAATGSELSSLRGHNGWVWTVAFSPDGQLLASGGRDNTARVWDVATGQEVAVLRGHNGWVLGVAFSPDGALLATAGGDGTARLWSVNVG